MRNELADYDNAQGMPSASSTESRFIPSITTRISLGEVCLGVNSTKGNSVAVDGHLRMISEISSLVAITESSQRIYAIRLIIGVLSKNSDNLRPTGVKYATDSKESFSP